MKKKGFMTIAMAIVLGMCCACRSNQSKRVNWEAETDSAEVRAERDLIELFSEVADSVAEEDFSGGGGLNDIH